MKRAAACSFICLFVQCVYVRSAENNSCTLQTTKKGYIYISFYMEWSSWWDYTTSQILFP